MNVRIKTNLEQRLAQCPVVIDIGCGSKRHSGECLTIDRLDLPHVDIVADIEKGFPFLPDGCADKVICRSVLEHIDDFQTVLREILRILKPTGRAEIYVPHFSNPYFYSDYTHKRFFGLYTFYYFVEPEKQLRRKVPVFYSDIRLEICKLRLVFRSPFWLSRQLRKAFGALINLCPRTQEFYELHLAYLVPCDGIEIEIRKTGDL